MRQTRWQVNRSESLAILWKDFEWQDTRFRGDQNDTWKRFQALGFSCVSTQNSNVLIEAWEYFTNFFIRYQAEIRSLASRYKISFTSIETAIEDGTSPSRLTRYYRVGYKRLKSLSIDDFYITTKHQLSLFRDIINICYQTLDPPVDDENDLYSSFIVSIETLFNMLYEYKLIRNFRFNKIDPDIIIRQWNPIKSIATLLEE
jgi:hypothetical protein